MLLIFPCSVIVAPMSFLPHNYASQYIVITVCTAVNALHYRNVRTRLREKQSTLSNFEMGHTLMTERLPQSVPSFLLGRNVG
jgi:hypothetical protein